jgi:YcxB-like protein
MTHQATITYTHSIIRRAVAHFWFRFVAWHGFAAIAICVGGAVALAVAGDRSWKLGVLGTFGFVLLTMSAAVYIVFLRRSMSKFERMGSKTVVFTFSDERLATASDLGNSVVSWKAIERIWKFPDIWLLFVAKTAYITLPITDIDKATQDFIVEQVVQHGGRVV